SKVWCNDPMQHPPDLAPNERILMHRIDTITLYPEALAHRISFARTLAVAVPLSLMLLMVGVVGLGLALRNGDFVPPVLDVRITHIRIAAYRTHYPECPPHTLCPLETIAPSEAYYVVWSVYELATAAQPNGRTAHRLLVVRLKR